MLRNLVNPLLLYSRLNIETMHTKIEPCHEINLETCLITISPSGQVDTSHTYA